MAHRPWRFLASIAALLVLLPPPAARSQEAADRPVTADEMRRDILFLADDALAGRRTGTPEASAAAAYLAGRFEEIGLRPGAPDGTYLQRFPFPRAVRSGPGSLVEIRGAGGPASVDASDFAILGFSAAGSAEGPMVFAGYGITAADRGYDDYAGQDAAGAVVFVLRGEPPGALFDGDSETHYADLRYKAWNAREHRAAALVLVDPPEQADDSLLALSGRQFGDAGIPVVHVRRRVLEEAFRAAGRDLERHWIAMAHTQAPDSFRWPEASARVAADVQRVMTSAWNVVGLVPGRDPALAGRAIVLGAHYDHLGMGGEESLAPGVTAVHNGADDNASGVAAIIAAGARLAADPPRRSVVIVAFAGEEEGLLGAAAYADAPAVPLDRTDALVNLDMVGRLRDDRLVVGGVGTAAEWPEIVPPLVLRAGLRIEPVEGGIGRSDHTVFFLRGVPVLFLFTGVHDDYHRPTDDPDTLNWDGLARIAFLTLDIVRAVDRRDAALAFRNVAGERPGGEGVRDPDMPYLGTVPDYAREVEGVLLSGVRPGSPAERAGLAAGDTIVRLAGREVRSLHDLANVLRTLRAGDEVEIAVLRGDTIRTITVRLGRRGDAGSGG